MIRVYKNKARFIVSFNCLDCNKEVFENCGHIHFGNTSAIHRIYFEQPNKKHELVYYYVVSQFVVNQYYKYYLQFQLKDMYCYWCYQCNKQVDIINKHNLQNNHIDKNPDGIVSKECGHMCYNMQMRDLTFGKVYWCDECKKQVNKNCGHFNFGNYQYFLDINGERKYLMNKLRKQKNQSKRIRAQLILQYKQTKFVVQTIDD